MINYQTYQILERIYGYMVICGIYNSHQTISLIIVDRFKI